MMKSKKLMRALCITLAILTVAGILLAADRVLRPKYLSTSPDGLLTAEYYAAAEAVNHDVLFIGDCEVYETFVPAVLWESYGISSYVRGNAQQLAWHSYYLLEDALRYDTPKAVVYNVLALKYGMPQSEAYNRMALDGMEWSQSKVEAIRASMTEEETFASYVWPFLRFHSRWSELTAEDFRYAFSPLPTVSDSGYLMRTDIIPMPEDAVLEGSPLTDYTLPATSMAYLDKMRELCQIKGIELILVKAPTNTWGYWWYDEWDEQILDYADTHGLSYYNLIDYAEDMGIDWQTDTYDAGIHLNVYGAEKVSRWFGEILSRAHGVPDVRSDPVTASVWEERVTAYQDRKTALEKGD